VSHSAPDFAVLLINYAHAMNRRIKRQIIIAALVLTAIIGGLALIAQVA